MKTLTYIVLVKVGATNLERSDLENASLHVWDSKEHYLNKLCFNEDKPTATEDIRFIPIHEFTEWWNDQDDDTLEDDKMENCLKEDWMGYCIVKA